MFDETVSTLFIILEHAFLQFPLVLGAYISISLMKVPDLSLESAYVCGSIVGARVLILTNNWPLFICMPVCFIASIIGGTLTGLTASLLTQKAKFPHLLSSILTIGLFHGLNQFFLGTSNISISNKRNLLGYLDFIRRHPELPEFAIAFTIIALLGYFFLRTQLGTSLTVYGNNPQFFSHYGISTSFIFITGLLLSNGLAGLAGFFDAQASGFVDISMGSLKALFCITSIILGKAIVRTERPYSILIPIVGSLSYFLITQMLLKVNFNLKYYTMVQSALVATILIMRYKRNSARTNHLGV